MRVAYFGTPTIAVAPLHALIAAGHEIPLVVTGPDARRGRGSATSPTPVAEAALEAGLAVVHDPVEVVSVAVDVGVVVAFGQILRPPVLGSVPLVNLHFSSLPRWRGAAPVERAILAGDPEIGVCVMEVAEGLDTGGIYAQATVPSGTKTLHELWSELSDLGSRLLIDWLDEVDARAEWVAPRPQVGEPVYADKLSVEDRYVDVDRPAAAQLAVIRLGGAWTTVGEQRLKLLAAHLEGDELVIDTVQPQGRRPMSMADWMRGTPADRRGPFS